MVNLRSMVVWKGTHTDFHGLAPFFLAFQCGRPRLHFRRCIGIDRMSKGESGLRRQQMYAVGGRGVVEGVEKADVGSVL